MDIINGTISMISVSTHENIIFIEMIKIIRDKRSIIYNERIKKCKCFRLSA